MEDLKQLKEELKKELNLMEKEGFTQKAIYHKMMLEIDAIDDKLLIIKGE